MEFTLYYRGPLKAATGRNKRKDHKHDLRRHFHKQLKELWKLPQLSEFQNALLVPEPETLESRALLRRVGQYPPTTPTSTPSSALLRTKSATSARVTAPTNASSSTLPG
jgi:hypothetical protein